MMDNQFFLDLQIGRLNSSFATLTQLINNRVKCNNMHILLIHQALRLWTTRRHTTPRAGKASQSERPSGLIIASPVSYLTGESQIKQNRKQIDDKGVTSSVPIPAGIASILCVAGAQFSELYGLILYPRRWFER